ncbi:NAD(P)-binding domain-containing protein [Streptomyces sp. NPDC048383]|uniref:NAD(P)-dependent oxidoreductase n=1 Tax=Streptomyces sp. NPDC048383 TaxID=3155386 RepID=UPI0034352F48
MTNNHDETGRSAVTVIGLGLMGRALAEAFVRAGHPTTVWNRTQGKATDLVSLGARLAPSIEEAVAAGPLVVLCVTDYPAVGDLLAPLGEVLQGRVLVNLTSGTSREARESAALAGERGAAAYLDGAVMAAPAAIGTVDAAIILSGPRAAFDQHGSALGSLAGAVTHLGEDHGLSSLYDAAGLGLMWSVLNGFLHGAALLGAAGVDASAFAPFAQQVAGTVNGWLPEYARQIQNGTHPAVDATIDTHVAAMTHLVEESELLGVDTALPTFIKTLAEQAVAEGCGGDGYTALIEQFRKPF